MDLSSIFQSKYYFLGVLSPDAKPNNDDNISTLEGVALVLDVLYGNHVLLGLHIGILVFRVKVLNGNLKVREFLLHLAFIADCTFSK